MLIVDEIVLDDVDLTCYLNSALSNGCYSVKVVAFELMRIKRVAGVLWMNDLGVCVEDVARIVTQCCISRV